MPHEHNHSIMVGAYPVPLSLCVTGIELILCLNRKQPASKIVVVFVVVCEPCVFHLVHLPQIVTLASFYTYMQICVSIRHI